MTHTIFRLFVPRLHECAWSFKTSASVHRTASTVQVFWSVPLRRDRDFGARRSGSFGREATSGI